MIRTHSLIIQLVCLVLLTPVLLQTEATAQSLGNTRVDGYKGIWFELNQKYRYGDKYSGGLGTYTAKHMPIAIYAPEVEKTFFVFGGTKAADSKHLLCMIGYFDHVKNEVPKPLVVHDKMGVDDPHDNPSLSIDAEGYLWVFISGRSTKRPGYKYRSSRPYDISHFDFISEEEMTYPQPWYDEENGFLHFFTKYSGVRELYFETSRNGRKWSDDQKLSGIVEPGFARSGHYQISGKHRDKIGTFFNRHQDGHPDTRTDLYYLQTVDFGAHWQNAAGHEIDIPLSMVDNNAKVHSYQALGKNAYLKDMDFDVEGNPVCLHLISNGHEPGPENGPYEWILTKWSKGLWETYRVCRSDHNYDMGSLYTTDSVWYVVAPSDNGPQRWGAGGEIVIWSSEDEGKTWKISRQVTQHSPLNHSYIRRPLQAKSPFMYYWADGNTHVLSPSRLYFGDFLGNTWQLPYEMENDLAEPEQINLMNR